MDFSGFIGNLKTHEMEMKVREERKTPKKKVIAFKATPFTINEDSSEDRDEDFAVLIRRVGIMFYEKGRQNNFRRERPQGRFEQKEEIGPCFHCKKTTHLIADYPSLQATTSKNVQKKKKAMVATWDDSKTESEEEIDTAHVCFMANGEETSMVNLKNLFRR